MQLFGGDQPLELVEPSSESNNPVPVDLEERISKLEAEVASMKAILDQLL